MTALIQSYFLVKLLIYTFGTVQTNSLSLNLSKDEIAFFEENGFVGPFTAYTPQEMKAIRSEITTKFAHLPFSQLRNRHLDFSLMARLCSHPAIVERVADLLGDDLVLWRSQLLFMGIGEGIRWHQDDYQPVISDPNNHISVYLAISEATPENCLSLLPGSHKLSKEDLQSKYGSLMVEEIEGKGKTRMVFASWRRRNRPLYFPEVESSKAIHKMTLKPGEFFIFHPNLVHTSQSILLKGYHQIVSRKSQKFFAQCCNRLGYNSPPGWLRIAMPIRITVPSNKVLPAAFPAEFGVGHKCILLRGEDRVGVNEMGQWSLSN